MVWPLQLWCRQHFSCLWKLRPSYNVGWSLILNGTIIQTGAFAWTKETGRNNDSEVSEVTVRRRPHVSGYFWATTFSFRIQKFPRPHVSPVHTHPMVSGFAPEKLSLHVVPPYYFLFGKRLDTILLRHRIQTYHMGIHPSTRYRIRCRFVFSTVLRIQKYPDSLSNSSDTCRRGLRRGSTVHNTVIFIAL